MDVYVTPSFFRNNLTVMEPVVLYGRGATVDLKISNRGARSTPLLFEIQDRHLADCHNPKRALRFGGR